MCYEKRYSYYCNASKIAAYVLNQEWLPSGPILDPGTNPTRYTNARLASRSPLSQNRPDPIPLAVKTGLGQSRSQSQDSGSGRSTASSWVRAACIPIGKQSLVWTDFAGSGWNSWLPDVGLGRSGNGNVTEMRLISTFSAVIPLHC